MSTQERVVLAIDAGQTGIKVRVQRADGASTDLMYPGIRTHEPLIPQLGRVAESAAAKTGASIEVLTAGVSGLTALESDATALRDAVSFATPPKVMLTHDSVSSFLGALGDSAGAVVAAGTGVVTLGVGQHRVARVDGWGNIMGDAGSGYWIGREALDAVMRAHDGRSEATALTEVVRARFTDLENAYIELQSADDRVAIVASFAEAVAELASTDAAAAQICVRAARELALSATTALRAVAEPDDDRPAVCAIGGIFRSSHIRERFNMLVLEAFPTADLRASLGAGIDGAVALSRLNSQHPLLSRVSIAD